MWERESLSDFTGGSGSLELDLVILRAACNGIKAPWCPGGYFPK